MKILFSKMGNLFQDMWFRMLNTNDDIVAFDFDYAE